MFPQAQTGAEGGDDPGGDGAADQKAGKDAQETGGDEAAQMGLECIGAAQHQAGQKEKDVDRQLAQIKGRIVERLVMRADGDDQKSMGYENGRGCQEANRVKAVIAVVEDVFKRSAAHLTPVTMTVLIRGSRTFRQGARQYDAAQG